MAVAVVYRPPAMTAQQYIASWSGGERPLFRFQRVYCSTLELEMVTYFSL